MTVKPITKQQLSIRPQSDIEKIYLSFLNDLVLSGKKPYVEMNENGDLLLSIENRGGEKK